jgi:hypothetical protein
MRFEEALEAMRNGKKAKRARWSNSSAMWIEKESGEMYTDDKPCDRSLSFEEITADDWVVISEIPSSVIKAMEEKTTKALEKIGKETEKKAKEQVPFFVDEYLEVYKRLEITFKSGETITYKPDEWDDYSFTGSAVVVKKNSTWIGIYNFDNIFCVELKEK